MNDAYRHRYERKFCISELDAKEIEYLIRHNPLMFSEIFYERQVNNLYFDSEGMNSYLDNILGNSKRYKMRIRWYGKTFGIIKDPVLELKIKEGEISKKLDFKIKEFSFGKNISKEFLQEIFSESNLPSWLMEILKSTRPSLLNCYKRKYFLSDNKKYRLTIDYDLAFFEIKNQRNSFNNKIRNLLIVILELKYDKKNDKGARQIMQFFPFRMTKSSKYVFGVEHFFN